MIREPDGAVTRHVSNPLAPDAPDAEPTNEGPAPDAPPSLEVLRSLDLGKASGQDIRKALISAGVDVPDNAKKAELAALAQSTLDAAAEADETDEDEADETDGE